MIIDLRSDTLSLPTEGMLQTMQKASVGDDVWGEDPSVKMLEELCAETFGKEAGLFCPSGTMCNQIAIKVLSTSPGEMLCEKFAHVYQYEGGGAAFNAGLSVRAIETASGILQAKQVAENIHPNDVHYAETQLLCIENTSNRGGGTCYTLQGMQDITAICQQHNIRLHLDGARIFNALVATNEQATDWGKCFNSISVCLSKGLGAPVGSVLLGSAEYINKAKRIRKVLGGGMRQAGYLAATGIYALHNHIERLQDDHIRASKIADLLQEMPYVQEVNKPQTNIVIYKLKDAYSVSEHVQKLNSMGIKAVPFGPQQVRMVTYIGISDNMINSLKERLIKVV